MIYIISYSHSVFFVDSVAAMLVSSVSLSALSSADVLAASFARTSEVRESPRWSSGLPGLASIPAAKVVAAITERAADTNELLRMLLNTLRFLV